MKMPANSNHPLLMEVMKQHGYQVGVLSKVEHSTPKESFNWDFVYKQSALGYGRNPDLYYQKAKEFFQRSKNTGKPFYFMVNSDDPHRPFFDPDQELYHGMARPSRVYEPEEIPVPGFLPDLPDVRREVSYYYNSVKRLDDTFGKVMLALEESGFKRNTLVMFMSDNGVALPFAKCDNYYASSRTPWIVRWPGVIKEGTVNNENLISGVDFFPTVLEAVGIKPEVELDGVSRLPLYKNENRESDDFVFTQIDNKAGGKDAPMRSTASPMRGIHSRNFIYIYNAWSYTDCIYYNNNEGITMQAMQKATASNDDIAKRVNSFRNRPLEEFYDVRKDPNCLINIIAESEYKDEIVSMKMELKQWMQIKNDPLSSIFLEDKSTEAVKHELYELYPDLKRVDAKNE
jgi:N-sulfoglucosamine sulfohydrolase